MIADSCVLIEARKLPIPEGEDRELVSKCQYGKALCLYLENKLPPNGIEVSYYCCEDWGWWVEIKDEDFTMGLCIHPDPYAEQDPEKYAVISSVTDEQKWSWAKLRNIDLSDKVTKVMDTVERIFREDSEIQSVSRHNECPFRS